MKIKPKKDKVKEGRKKVYVLFGMENKIYGLFSSKEKADKAREEFDITGQFTTMEEKWLDEFYIFGTANVVLEDDEY